LEESKNDIYKDLLKKLDIQNPEQLHTLVHQLGDPDLFFEKFLMIKNEEHESLLRNIESGIRSFRGFQRFNSQYMPEDLELMTWKNKRKSKNYNVYLFIEKIDGKFYNSTIFRNVITRFTNYGIFHVGLEIDGIIIEWGYGLAGPSIVCPIPDTRGMLACVRVNYQQTNSVFNLRLCISAIAISIILGVVVGVLTGGIGIFFTVLGATAALGIILVVSHNIIKKDSNRLKRIAEKCAYYNKTHNYNSYNTNCQHFVDEVLESIGLEFKPEGEFKEFMDRIKYNENCSFQFKDKVFDSRTNLNDYANEHWSKIKNKWDKKLLICYSDVMDRMYQDGKSRWCPMDDKKWQQRYEEFF
ncbi:5087_t:CDS:1, partial [Entrophospora sp. SA101]